MNYTMATYTVRPEKIKEARKAIAEFLAEIRRHEPRTLYLVFREKGRHSFVHWMAFENEAAERRHSQASYNQHFVKKLLPLCVGKAAFAEFALFGATKKQWVLG
jgi:quinol monooxygenase YgiN